MLTCHEIESLTTPHVDGETKGETAASVEAHLAWCAACRGRVAAERACRNLLRAEAAGLRPRAPDALRARCAEAAAAVRPARAGRRTRRWVPLSAAATLLLAIAGALILSTAHPVSALAARLASDHIICFSREAAQVSPPDPAGLERAWADRHGWRIVVPAGSAPLDLTLVELRRCRLHDGEMAHVMYRRGGRPLSLYVLRDTSVEEASLDIMGHEAVIWSSNGRTYAVIGETQDAAETATYVRRIVG